VWAVGDILRGDYRQSDYGKVILSMTVLRRLDCVQAPKKQKVLHYLSKVEKLSDSAKDIVLNKIAGANFHNRSQFDFAGVEEYVEREVKFHLPNVWSDESKTKIGYEINFSKYFYEFKPLGPPGKIKTDKPTQMFFAKTQNKLLYAVTGKTAADIILDRAEANKPPIWRSHSGKAVWYASRIFLGTSA
jgi:hypothetical protein